MLLKKIVKGPQKGGLEHVKGGQRYAKGVSQHVKIPLLLKN
jgi:hypothetical protein